MMFLWDFVVFRSGFRGRNSCWSFKPCTFSTVLMIPGEIECWHPVCSTYANNTKIGFPGWPKPNLDWVFGFGGQFRKRGLAPAPFFIFRWLAEAFPASEF
jgi:hypothetical protein